MLPTTDPAPAPKPARKRPARKPAARNASAAATGVPDAGQAAVGAGEPPATAPAASRSPKVGDVVQYTYFDHYAGAGGEDVTVPALVLGVGDEGATVIPLGGPHPTVPLDSLSAG